MFKFFKKRPPYTPPEIAAGYIEAFANDSFKNPYSWDDFGLWLYRTFNGWKWSWSDKEDCK